MIRGQGVYRKSEAVILLSAGCALSVWKQDAPPLERVNGGAPGYGILKFKSPMIWWASDQSLWGPPSILVNLVNPDRQISGGTIKG